MRVKKIIFMIVMIIAGILLYSVNTYAAPTYIEGKNTVKVGENIQLRAYEEHALDGVTEETEKVDITEMAMWRSSNSSIATVERGLVKGVAEGTVTITAKIEIDGPSMPEASFEVKVTKPDSYSKTIYNIEITGDNFLVAGESTQFKAKYWEQEGIFEEGKKEPIEIKNERKNEADVTNKVTWESSNSAVATVDNKGLVKGVKEGTAKIIAKQRINDLELKAEHTIEIKDVNPPAEQVQSKLEIRVENNGGNKINKDGTLQLKAIRINSEAGVNMEEDVTNGVTWMSSNPQVATVDNKGLVKGLKPGKTIITAKYLINGVEKEAKYEITVQGNSENQNPQQPGTSGDGTTSKDPIPNTGLYGELILAIAVAIPIISFIIYKKYENVE